MSRVGYSEDEDYPGQFALYRANLERSLAGRRGQAALRDLEAALLELPEKRLIYGHVVKDGDVCANGALIAYQATKKGLTREEALAQMAEETAPACATCWDQKAAHPVGGGPCTACPARIERRHEFDADARPGRYGPFAFDLICQEYVVGVWDEDEDPMMTDEYAASKGVPALVAWAIVEVNDDLGGYRNFTDEQRYGAVLEWVQSRIKSVPVF